MIRNIAQLDCSSKMYNYVSFDRITIVSKNIANFFSSETVDPCTGKSKNKAEFGLTATSGMADVLCMFCQHIKNLQCIWQFCSHPEGVYKIKVSDSKG